METQLTLKATRFFEEASPDIILTEPQQLPDGRNFIYTSFEALDHSSINAVQLEKLFSRHDGTGRLFVFERFLPFKKNVKYLRLLQDCEADFLFLDLPRLDKNMLETFISYFNLEFEARSKKIKAGQQSTKAKPGRPDALQPANSARRARTLSAITDREYLKVKTITNLLFEQGKSPSEITRFLNENYISYAKGKQFYVTNVQRMKDSIPELLKDYKMANLRLDDSKITSDTFEIDGLTKDKNFDDQIVFNISVSQPIGFRVAILNNSEDLVFSQNYDPGISKVAIDLNDNNLLGGYHYISITSTDPNYTKDDILNVRILLRNDIRTFIEEVKEELSAAI